MTDTNQDKWKKILNNLSSEEYENIKASLKHLKSFAGSECLPLTEKQMAVMINEGSKDLKKFFDTLTIPNGDGTEKELSCIPWHGYFERLASVEIYHFIPMILN